MRFAVPCVEVSCYRHVRRDFISVVAWYKGLRDSGSVWTSKSMGRQGLAQAWLSSMSLVRELKKPLRREYLYGTHQLTRCREFLLEGHKFLRVKWNCPTHNKHDWWWASNVWICDEHAARSRGKWRIPRNHHVSRRSDIWDSREIESLRHANLKC